METMQTRTITLDVPADVLLSTHLTPDQFSQELREALAFKLFADGRLSGGKAAKFAGLPRLVFLLKAGAQDIDWLAYSADEVRRELSGNERHL